jgi:hypothetical protein
MATPIKSTFVRVCLKESQGMLSLLTCEMWLTLYLQQSEEKFNLQ